MKIEKFEEIKSWQKAQELTLLIYELTKQNNFSKDFGLKDQIRRASISVMSNIAEGFERESNKEFKRFLLIAKSSAGEVRSQLYIAKSQNYISELEFEKSINLALDCTRLISKFITFLRQTL